MLPEEKGGLSNLTVYSDFYLSYSLLEMQQSLCPSSKAGSSPSSFSEQYQYFIRHHQHINLVLIQSKASEDPEIRAQARKIENFCMETFPQVRELRKKIAEEVFATDDADDFVMFFSEDGKKVLAMAVDIYAQLKDPLPDKNRPWGQVAVYQCSTENTDSCGYEIQNAVNQKEIFTEIFKCFSSAYRLENNHLTRVVRFLKLPLQAHNHFMKATLYPFYKEKQYPTASSESHELEQCFKKAWDDELHWEDRKISAEWTQGILRLLHLQEKPKDQQALALYVLCALFSRYAGREIFGTAELSSEALRHMAAAFFNKACEYKDMSSSFMFEPNTIEDWRHRLLGVNPRDTSSCTSVLYETMIGSFKKLSHPAHKKIVDDIVPAAWR
jgi:hypothetical protein